jgi:hypothetical protein
VAACASKHPEIISNAFVSKEYADNGALAMNVFVRGVPATIVIDDLIPVHKGEPSFTSPAHSSSGLWPLFMERVWAKVNGNYENIIAGSGYEAIKFLTGAPTYTYNWEDNEENNDDDDDDLDADTLWTLIKEGT